MMYVKLVILVVVLIFDCQANSKD